MKDWHKLDADVVKLMNKHFTTGRSGHKIDMVVIHHNAGILSIDQIWDVWQTRQASAHYQVESGGRIGQLVWDGNTAWHAANSNINARSIGIEVSNSAGPAQDWPITDTAIVEAGKLAAAVCHHHKLGRPVSGQNIRFHREFTSTSCPYHLAPGGKYHQRLMQAAHEHFDWMAGGGQGVEEGITVSEADRIITHMTDFIKGYVGPLIEDSKDTRGQLTGSRDSVPGDPQASYPGWPQLGQDSEGRNLTMVDGLAAARRDIAELGKRIDRIEGK